VVIVIPVL